MANGSTLIADDPAPFQYTTAALLCNALWFSSLALSLTCALMATLVDQWARDFLHRTEIHPAPVLRARVLSFLYLGLKQFHMHTFVEIIPVFLHLSLFLFFGGLVAFLLPINLALTYLVGIIFIVFFCFYVFLTGLPVICRACPYRTPLSGGLWRLKHYFDVYIGSKNDDRSMMEAMSEDALKKSADRDRHAVRWTLASLTDDKELLPFVEAIPDVIHGPKGFHSVNDHLFLPILDSKEPQLSLSSRIVGLLRSSVNLPLDDTSRIRCQASCLKAIWALGMSNAKSDRPSTHFAINTLDVLALKSLNPRYVLSACASVRYSRWNAYKSRIDGVREALVRFDTGVPQRHTVQTIKSMMDGLEEIGIPESGSFISRGDFESFRRHFRTLKSTTLSALEGTREGSIIVSAPLSDLKEAAQHLSAHNHWVVARIVILADFLLESLKTGIIPYELLTTCQEILPNLSGVVPVEIRSLEALFTSFPDPSAVASMTSDLHDVDKMVNISLRLLPFVPESPIRYTSLSALYRYIANRNSDKAVLYILKDCDIALLGSCIVLDLSKQKSTSNLSDDILRTTWILLFLKRRLWPLNSYYDWVKQLYSIIPTDLHSPAFSSFLAILDLQVLSDHRDILTRKLITKDVHSKFETHDTREALEEIHNHPLFLAHFPVLAKFEGSLGEECTFLLHQVMEIRLIVLARLFSSYGDDRMPYRGLETLKLVCGLPGFFGSSCRPETQLAFAEGVATVVQRLARQSDDPDAMEEILTTLWRWSSRWEFIDDATCASTLVEAVDLYLSLDGQDGRRSDEQTPSEDALRLQQRCHRVLAHVTSSGSLSVLTASSL